MFLTAIYFTPAIITLIWAMSFIFKTKNERQWILLLLLLVKTFYYTANAVYLLPETDYLMYVKMDALCVPAVFTVLALQTVYIYLLRPKNRLNPSHFLLMLPAIIFGVLVNLMYYILGFDNIARLVETYDRTGFLADEFKTELYRTFIYIDDKMVDLFLLIAVIMFIVYVIFVAHKEGYKFGDVYRFTFKNDTLRPSLPKIFLVLSIILILFPYAALGRRFMFSHVHLTIVMMVLLGVVNHLLCHMEYYSSNMPVTFAELLHTKEHEDSQSSGIDTGDATNNESVRLNARQTKLEADFASLMDHGAYKDENVSLQSLSEQLGVSARTLSSHINAKYEAPFRDVVNSYRIDASKKYMHEHPEATQAEIACECGFKDSSAFNKKFKEMEGITPAMWIARAAASGFNGKRDTSEPQKQ